MKAYLDILREIRDRGTWKGNRTGTRTLSVSGTTFKHDMAEGFPLLTTKKMFFRGVKVENEFFIKGLTDKKWLQERRVHIWDEWCSPAIIPYSTDPEIQARMAEERDLGPIYGFQWRHFGAEYRGYDVDYTGQGVDQLAEMVDKIKNKPEDRRIIVSSWNPAQIAEMALPPCHYSFQVLVRDGKLDLMWNQRSIDSMLGLPFNIAGYGLLLHLLAQEANLEEGELTGFLGDTHIYEPHMGKLEEQLAREPRPLPTIETEDFTSIFEWRARQTKIKGYDPHPKIKFDIVV